MNVYNLVRELMASKSVVFGDRNGDFPLTRQPAGFDDPGVERFYRFLRRKGLKVSEVPHSYLLERFPKARKAEAVGYSLGRDIFVANDYRGRPLTEAERTAIAAHEYGHTVAGESESDAQRVAVRVLSKFQNPAALKKAIEFGTYENWLPQEVN